MIGNRQWWMRTGMTGLVAAAGVGFLAGRATSPTLAIAAPPEQKAAPAPLDTSRFVAYIHGGKVPITREEFGEYLIARYGADKIDFLVNKTIIDTACKEKGIVVTDAEVDEAFNDDLKDIKVNRQQFIDGLLKQYGVSLYEWKQDRLRPALQIKELCQLNVSVTEEEIQKAFEAEFGPKVEGRIILFPKGQEQFAFKSYESIRSSDEKFDELARQQAVSHLAASGGRIKPFGKGTGTNAKLEAEAFQLKPGQITTIIDTQEGAVVFKLDRIVPPDANAKLEDHRPALTRLVYDKKLAMEVPKQFKALRDAANPVVLIKKQETPEELERKAQMLLQTGATEKKK